jgi:hypothetical protein
MHLTLSNARAAGRGRRFPRLTRPLADDLSAPPSPALPCAQTRSQRQVEALSFVHTPFRQLVKGVQRGPPAVQG